jgi:hypothetical protein
VAGLPSLVASGAKSLLKDKATEFLSPQQMEFAQFAMNPQLYLAEKGIAAVANMMGYGNQLKELQAGAKDEKDYYKETMRDAIGSVLPAAIGQFVRATPQGVDAPAGTYTVWNPETQSYEQNQSSSPVVMPNAFSNEQFDAKFNPNSMFNVDSPTYMGAQAPGTLQPQVNTTDLLEMLDQYRQPSNNSTSLQELLGSSDYGSNMQENVFNPDMGGGDFSPSADALMDMGIAGGKFNEYYQDAYKRGGQIRRGRR